MTMKIPKSARAYFSALGKKGSRARAKALTPERREEIARTAAEARWKKARKEGR
jgi:hypothetical protein